jgi:sorting nexin-9/18/33
MNRLRSMNSFLGRFEQDFIEERRRQLELWLNRICHHPVLCASYPVQHFIKCEPIEKSDKVI